MNGERRKRTGRRISTGAPLLVFALGSAGCQIVFGLDDYKDAPAPPPHPSCADLTPPAVSEAGPGIRGVRRLGPLSSATWSELTSGGYCVGSTCYVFYQR